MSQQYRTESKDSITETAAQAKARGDAAEARNDKLHKELAAVRADNAASDPIAARKRRQDREDSKKGAFSYTKAPSALGSVSTHTDSDAGTDDGDAEKARARRIARTSR